MTALDKGLPYAVDHVLDVPPFDDETINRIADESFLEYDAREAEDSGLGNPESASLRPTQR